MVKDELAAIIGDNVAKYRSKAGLTQAQLAECANVTTVFISNVECGKKMMSVSTLCEVAKALNVSCDALLKVESTTTHRENIDKLLDGESLRFLSGVEAMLRACKEHFGDE